MADKKPATPTSFPRLATIADDGDNPRTRDKSDVTTSSVSTSETAYYCQESFDSFRQRVIQLCAGIFVGKTVLVERMKGGSFNRVTALTVSDDSDKSRIPSWLRKLLTPHLLAFSGPGQRNLMLRSQRDEDGVTSWGFPYDIRCVQFTRGHFGNLIPTILHADETCENALGQPYTIQNRLPGLDFHNVWATLSITQKECAMRLIVALTERLHAITNSTAGVIAPLRTDNDTEPIRTQTFIVGSEHAETWTKAKSTPAEQQTTLQLLCQQAERWQEFDLHQDDFVFKTLGQMKRIAQSLHELGFIPDTDRFYFCHLDLFPRNMLVELPDDSTLKITGVLDWDAAYAHFCPKFVAYRAPFWMWHDDDANEWDETLATKEPTSTDGLRLKQLFEELASDEWKRYAFTPEYVLARRIFEVLKTGLKGNDTIREAENIVAEWQRTHYDSEIETMKDLVNIEKLRIKIAKRQQRNASRRDMEENDKSNKCEDGEGEKDGDSNDDCEDDTHSEDSEASEDDTEDEAEGYESKKDNGAINGPEEVAGCVEGR